VLRGSCLTTQALLSYKLRLYIGPGTASGQTRLDPLDRP
jgi:hypothetical protein